VSLKPKTEQICKTFSVVAVCLLFICIFAYHFVISDRAEKTVTAEPNSLKLGRVSLHEYFPLTVMINNPHAVPVRIIGMGEY
jgi:hypothetical protein